MTRLRWLAVRWLSGALVAGIAGFMARALGRVMLQLGVAPLVVVSVGVVSAVLGFLAAAFSNGWQSKLWAADARASDEHPGSARALFLLWGIGLCLAVSVSVASLVPAGRETLLFVLASAIAGFGPGAALFTVPPPA